jgi:hypothetical protein
MLSKLLIFQVQLCNNEVIYLEFHEEASRALWKEWEKKIDLLNNKSLSKSSPFKIDPKLKSIAENASKPAVKKKVKKKRSERTKSRSESIVKKHKKKTKHKEEKNEEIDESQSDEANEAAVPPIGAAEAGFLSDKLESKIDTHGSSHDPVAKNRHRKSGRGAPVTLLNVSQIAGSSPKDNLRRNNIWDRDVEGLDNAQDASRARWRKLAIQTRFVFHKSRKVSFGVAELFAKAYCTKANGFKSTLRRAESMSGFKTKSSPHVFEPLEQSNDLSFKERRLKRSSSLPLVCEGEASFLESQPSSEMNLVQNSRKVSSLSINE